MWCETLFLSLLLPVAFSAIEAERCPELYRRFSLNHTFCLPASTTCTIVNRGVSEKDKLYILQLHNEYRSKVATGQEIEAGGLPSAANMLEMVWDDELAAIAQKHAETCNYAHDCPNCRRVQSFSVGQNIGLVSNIVTPPSTADWHSFIKNLYNEVVHFNKNFIKLYLPGPQDATQYGHFTQMMWASSWRIGCGWTLFEDDEKFKSFTVCNYGPGGNLIEDEIYEVGPACSACPMNSCCEEGCNEYNMTAEYPGLCKVVQQFMSPEGSGIHDAGNYSLYCNFNHQTDCKVKFEGKPWMMVRTPGGNWLSNILRSGETTKLIFSKSFEIEGKLCFILYARSGPNVDGKSLSGNGVSIFDSGLSQSRFELKNKNVKNIQEFVKNIYRLKLPEGKKYQFQYSFEFSVPPGSPAQFVEIKKLSAAEC